MGLAEVRACYPLGLCNPLVLLPTLNSHLARDTRSQSRSETYRKTSGFHVADKYLAETALVAEPSRSQMGMPATCVSADFILHPDGYARWPAALQGLERIRSDLVARISRLVGGPQNLQIELKTFEASEHAEGSFRGKPDGSLSKRASRPLSYRADCSINIRRRSFEGMFFTIPDP